MMNVEKRLLDFVHYDEVAMAFSSDIETQLMGGKTALSCFKTYASYVAIQSKRCILVDWGGSTLRVAACDISVETKNVNVLNLYQTCIDDFSNKELNVVFDCIASNICRLSTQYINTETIQIGFTFSFPIEQNSRCSGLVTRWAKEFDYPVGFDPAQLLSDSLAKISCRSFHIESLLNDTTATLLFGQFTNPSCYIGMILGTGMNMCVDFPEYGILNLEAGNVYRSLPVTFLDRWLDDNSSNKKLQLAEKMVGGMYLEVMFKEVLRSLKVELGDEKVSCKLIVMCANVDLEGDDYNSPFNPFFKHQLNVKTLLLVKEWAQFLLRRSAGVAASLVGGAAYFLNKKGVSSVNIAIDGSLYTQSVLYKTYFDEFLQYFNLTYNLAITCQKAEQGSLFGAGLAFE